MPDPVNTRLQSLAADRNLDVEDLRFVIDAALADGVLTTAEASALSQGMSALGTRFEPAARKYLSDVLAGQRPLLPNRVLLAPAPKGAQRELYYSRNDVVALQEALGALGFSTTVDGDFGPGTSTSVSAFQKSVGLGASGVIDGVTLSRLNQALEAKGRPLLDLSPRARIRPDQVVAMKGGANTADNRMIQAALTRLGKHFGIAALQGPEDGVFSAKTEGIVKVFQARAYLAETGIVDCATLECLNCALEAVGLAPTGVCPEDAAPAGSGKVELHFYPGDAERKLYVKRDGRLMDIYGMVGGEATGRDDPHSDKVDYSPSPKGTYTVVEVNPHASGAWAWSYVPYGSALREQSGEVQYQNERGVWQWATGPNSVFKGRNPEPLERKHYLDESGKLLKFWNKNDFGHLRGRLKSVASGQLQGHMIHSSAWNQGTDGYFTDTDRLVDPAAALAVLHTSHGCEHIHPKDMDEMIAKGYMAVGTSFVVHGYDERWSGPALA